MTTDLLIEGGRIIDPARGRDETGSLLVSEGKIAWVGNGDKPRFSADCEVLPARGLVVCPGFIDLHCHLREPGFEQKETIATGTAAAARGGFTTVCCMPNTLPPLDNRAAIEWVRTKAAAEGVVRVLPIGCVTKGRLGKELADMTELAAAGVAGFSDDGDPVADAGLLHEALIQARGLGLPVIDHCEDKAQTAGGQINSGVVAARLGLAGMPASAEEDMVARDLRLAEETGGRVHIAHVSTEGSVELVRRAKEKGVRVTAEVTPHHLTLTEELVLAAGTNAKVNPPLRTRRDVDALVAALNEGVIDAIATDHAPHAESDKKCDFARAAFGISGFETVLGSLMGLVRGGQVPLSALIARLTSGPAAILNERFGRLGTLAVGAPADITIFDPDREWVVDPAAFVSKGKNTPLAGEILRGKVMATVCGGRVVYAEESLGIIKSASYYSGVRLGGNEDLPRC